MSEVRIRPRPGWALLLATEADLRVKDSGLVYPMDKDSKVSEGVFRVLDASPRMTKEGVVLPLGFEIGDLVLCRNYLKFANPVGHLLPDEKRHRQGLVHVNDVLATVSGEGTIGLYDEYRVG